MIKSEKQVERWLMEALLALMYEKPFREIKIKEISEKAQLARCTFYRYYESKEALLLGCCKSVVSQFSEKMTKEKTATMYATAVEYFRFWEEHKDFLTLLRKSDLLYFFIQSYDDFMFEVSKSLKYEDANMDGFSFSPKIRYHYFFGINGLWGIANRWLMHGCKESPDELAQYVISFIVESYENEPDCQHYAQHKAYPYSSCYIKPGYEM